MLEKKEKKREQRETEKEIGRRKGREKKGGLGEKETKLGGKGMKIKK